VAAETLTTAAEQPEGDPQTLTAGRRIAKLRSALCSRCAKQGGSQKKTKADYHAGGPVKSAGGLPGEAWMEEAGWRGSRRDQLRKTSRLQFQGPSGFHKRCGRGSKFSFISHADSL